MLIFAQIANLRTACLFAETVHERTQLNVIILTNPEAAREIAVFPYVLEGITVLVDRGQDDIVDDIASQFGIILTGT